MDEQLLAQLKSWNPWWQQGPSGVDRYKDPEYKRELYADVFKQFKTGGLIISIVGMRQVGKSTIMRQLIRDLLHTGLNPKNILYVSFDDPYLRASYNQQRIFEDVVRVYAQDVLGEDISITETELFFFFDEVHQLPQWEKSLKSYYDRSFPIRYVVSGSSSIQMQTKNRESLLGRISEHTLWPFSFREYVACHAQKNNTRLLTLLDKARIQYQAFTTDFKLQPLMEGMENIHRQIEGWHKPDIINHLKTFIVEGGFPRVWQQPDFASKQRTLWEQHVGKVLFEDLPQVAKIRKVKDLEFLYVRLIDFNAKEVKLTELQHDLEIHWETLNRYLEYLRKTFLVFRVDRTKTRRADQKRRSGNVKFYVTDVALRNALRKKTEEVFAEPEEMAFIAETLVCTAMQRWLIGPRRDDALGYYRDKSGEVDFVIKTPNIVIPVEVKWRNDIPSLKTLDRLCKTWGMPDSIVVTKDLPMMYERGRLSLPLWSFLLFF